MWIRLESRHEDCCPMGIYQDFSWEHLMDFCGPVTNLPVPNCWVMDKNDCFPTFWFTRDGWEWYGCFFGGLFEPEARKEDDATILVSIIENPEDFHPLYEDEYQVALSFDETIWITSSPRWEINSLKDWEEFERELISIMTYKPTEFVG